MALLNVVKFGCHREGGERSEKSVNGDIEACRNEVMGKSKSRFPNLAGFCRYLGVGIDTLEEAFSGFKESWSALCAVFEDEALNSELSPTVVTAYLKQRLGYGEKQEMHKASCELPELKLVFDHDIFEDGG